MGVAVPLHGGFLKKERLKLGGAAYIAICGRASCGRQLTLRGTVIEFLTARIAFLARSIGRWGSVDYAFGNDTTENVKTQDGSGRGLTYPIRSPAPTDSAYDLLRELLLEDNRL
jgi:hypothetical protein